MRKLAFLLAMLVVLGVITIPALVTGAQEGQAGDSNIVQVDLHPPDVFGTMHYNLSGCTIDFVFNGHGLTPGDTYELRFRLSATEDFVLGEGIANEGGNVHITGSASPSGNIWRKRVDLYQINGVERRVLRSAARYTFYYDCSP
jgi:hypothetical protein